MFSVEEHAQDYINGLITWGESREKSKVTIALMVAKLNDPTWQPDPKVLNKARSDELIEVWFMQGIDRESAKMVARRMNEIVNNDTREWKVIEPKRSQIVI
jgi:hypothetical protein